MDDLQNEKLMKLTTLLQQAEKYVPPGLLRDEIESVLSGRYWTWYEKELRVRKTRIMLGGVD